MRRLSRVRFTPTPNLPDPESQDVQLGSQLLIAGKDRGFNQHGEKLVDVELTDDEANRRVLLQVEGEEDSFVPYERVCKGWFATPDPIDPELIEAQRKLWLEATADSPYLPRITAAREAAAAAEPLPELNPATSGAICPHCDKPCADARGLASHVRAKHPG